MTSTELTIINENTIKDKIYVIRGIPVMLDRDLALIYGYSVKRLNEQVQRNIEKFPSDMMFQLNKDDMAVSRCQFGTSIMQSEGTKGGRTYYPYVFTEQGIYMLMTVLKGELATKQSIELVRLFKKMKDYISSEYNIWLEHDKKINKLELNMNTVNNKLDKLSDNLLLPERLKSFVISNNTRYEADIFFEDLFKEANKSIILIDNYVSIKTLKLLRNIEDSISVSIYTSSKSSSKDKLTKLEYKDFISDYPNINISIYDTNNLIHDRLIILDYKLDNQRVFSSGSSIKDTGIRLSVLIESKDLVINNDLTNIIDSKNTYKW